MGNRRQKPGYLALVQKATLPYPRARCRSVPTPSPGFPTHSVKGTREPKTRSLHEEVNNEFSGEMLEDKGAFHFCVC